VIPSSLAAAVLFQRVFSSALTMASFSKVMLLTVSASKSTIKNAILKSDYYDYSK